MRNRKLVFIIAVMTVFALCIQTTVVCAESLSEIREKIEQKEAELEKGEKQEKSLASQVTELEKELGQLETAIAEGEARLVKLEKELAKAQKRLEIQNKNLNARLRNMYKSGSIGFLDVLLDSGSFSEFLTNLDLVKRIYSSDQDFMDELQEAHDEVEKKKNEVETLQAELKESKNTKENEKATVEAKKKEIAASNEETEKMIDELQADADALVAKIQSEKKATSSETSKYDGGEMAWPVPSCHTITSYFGYRIHPIYGYSKLHTGLDIGASYGASIVAANSGTVIYAGWDGGSGTCVIIDHGGGITTLYGHNSSLSVSYGQQVSRGQHIANAGSTGNSTGPHCHFEVRVNGGYVDPLNYL